MYWTNVMNVTLKDAETAAAALEILKARLTDGFDCDNNYRRSASTKMRDNMEVVDNTIVLPDDFGAYFPDHSMIVMPELMQYLAKHLSEETFTFETYNTSDNDESWVTADYANGELNIEEVYFPNGFGSIFCSECGEEAASMADNTEGNIWIVSATGELIASKEELEKGKTFICPECGEEIDLSDWVIISNKTIKII